MSRISVIIPTKNRVDFLKETLNNLLSQSRIPDEIIVIDDHSTDNTVEEIQTSYPEVIILNAQNNGPGAARNQGFKCSTGDFIKFIDSDDLITLNLIEDQENILRIGNYDAVYNTYFKATEKEPGIWIQEDAVMHFMSVPKSLSIRKLMIRGFFIPIPTFMFKRDVLVEIGAWNEEMVAYEDFDFLWRLTRYTENFAHSNGAAMLYRIHGKQTTENNVTNLGRQRDKIKCWEPIVQEINTDPKFNLYDRILGNFLYRKIYSFLLKYEESGEKNNYSFPQLIVELTERVRNKIGRIQTGTQWGKAYGPNSSKEVFDSYIRMIKGEACKR